MRVSSDGVLPATCDVAVAGGGAAGLMAALQAARRGRRTVLLEKNARPGLKILISGGGRCNLTTTKSGRELEEQYGLRRGRWLRHALRAFPPRALVAMIEDAGVPLHEEDLDKIFPVSGRARDVLDALLVLTELAGVMLVREAPLTAAEPCEDGLALQTPRGVLRCGSLIVATGGVSYPKTGSTGDGYAIARAFGHALVPPVPHLAPLPIDEPWVRALAGIVLDGPTLAVAPRGGAVLCKRRRPILFTHKGLSGPAPMDLSGFVEERGGGCELIFDFAPAQTAEQLGAALLAAAAHHGKRRITALLPRTLPERLRQALAARAGGDVPAATLTRPARQRLLELLKDTRVPVERSAGFAHAEVTRGGIPLHEVDARTMASKLRPGLFLCGEVLDVDGPIGGFNFQAAFATGRLAGMHA